MTAELYQQPLFRVAGDRAILMEFGDGISPEIHARIRAMAVAVAAADLTGVIEYLPSYRSLALLYDPLQTSFARLRQELSDLQDNLAAVQVPKPRVVTLPVCYGGERGPDLAFVASHHQLTPTEVVALHTAPAYLVYMIGFTPGFPYLGGLPEQLHTPRLASPRKRVPAGSVGIANGQTGVYPIASPGGWQLIGQTPLRLFDPERESPFLLNAGDLLRFTAIDEEEFAALAAKPLPQP
jgi:inhibitor of KinA